MRNRLLLALGCIGASVIFVCVSVAGVWFLWQGWSGEEPLAMLTPATPIPTTGIITGLVLDDDGNPLGNIIENETLIVALFCLSDDSDIECLREDFWDMDMGLLIANICEADDTASSCLLHLGQSATTVEADGSYTIADVPPGEYGLVFILKSGGLTQISLKRDVGLVQVGEVTEYNIVTKLHRR